MKVVALCYHKVGTQADEGRRLNIHPHRLDSHVRFFQRKNFQFLKAGELEKWPDRPSVCFTFDDGYTSTVENGVPVFDRRKVPMTIYIISDSVDESSSWDGDLAQPLANWETIKKIQASGHEIGNHTATHPHLPELTLDQQIEEISRCHQAMLDHGLATNSFCYPYGHLNDDSSIALKKLGYKVGMAIGKRPARPTDDPLRFPRIVVAYGDTLPMILYKMHVRPKLK